MRRGLGLGLVAVLVLGACGTEAAEPESDWQVAHTSTQWWMSVYAPTPNDQLIVGGTTDRGAMLRFDGTEVTEVDLGTEVGLLNWIHGFDDGSLITVGTGGAVLRSSDGTTWTSAGPGLGHDLWGVWGASPDDVWAVGADISGDAPVVLRDTGAGFVPVPIPDLQRPAVEAFFKVWGSSADDVYIVGQGGAVLHWDGSTLTELLVGVSRDLIGVWGEGPDRVVLVGGRRNGAAAVWDGSSWSNPDLGRYPGLNGVWVSGDTAWVVGDNGAAGTLDLASGAISIEMLDIPIALHAVAGSPSTLTAVGGDFATGPDGPFLGQILTTDR